jgi:hypothetical protein
MKLSDTIQFLTHIHSEFDTNLTSGMKSIAAIEIVHQVPTEGILEIVKLGIQLIVALVAIFGKNKSKTLNDKSKDNLKKVE